MRRLQLPNCCCWMQQKGQGQARTDTVEEKEEKGAEVLTAEAVVIAAC